MFSFVYSCLITNQIDNHNTTEIQLNISLSKSFYELIGRNIVVSSSFRLTYPELRGYFDNVCLKVEFNTHRIICISNF